MDAMRLMVWLPYVTSGLFILLALPLAMRLVGPDRFYGVRTEKTLQNLEVWYAANTAGGSAMVVCAVLSIIIVFLLHTFWGTNTDLKVIIPVFVPVAMVFVSVAIGLRHAS